MRKILFALLLLAGMGTFLAGCSDDGPDPKKPAVQADVPQDDNWQWEEGDSYDPGYWPKWKNPCPGPACDPPDGLHPEWLVDPPDYDQERRAESRKQPPERPKENSANSR